MPLNFGACLNVKNQQGEDVNTFFNGRMRNVSIMYNLTNLINVKLNAKEPIHV